MHLLPRMNVMHDFIWTLPVQLRGTRNKWTLQKNLVHGRFLYRTVVLRICVALVVFQPYCDLEAGDNQSLKFKWRGGESNPGPLAPQAKSLTTQPLRLDVHGSIWTTNIARPPDYKSTVITTRLQLAWYEMDLNIHEIYIFLRSINKVWTCAHT